MTKEEYQKLIKKHYPKTKKFKNALIAFLVGGLMGIISEILATFLAFTFGMDKDLGYVFSCIIIIFLTSLFTGLGFFDDLIIKGKCGLIIPTTGFAHSMTSAAMEYRKDGMITGVGANVFKLAGSVILYGIVSAFFFCILKVIL